MTTSPEPSPIPLEPDAPTAARSREPLSEAVARARRVLLDVLERPTWPLDAAATRDLLVEASALSCQIAEVELRLLDHACRIRAGEDVGATSTATWLAHATRQTARATHAKARLAVAVVADDTVRRAMGRGQLLPDQAHAVLDAARRSSGARPDGVVDQLVAEASSHCAPILRMLGRATEPEGGATPQVFAEAATADGGEPPVGGALAVEVQAATARVATVPPEQPEQPADPVTSIEREPGLILEDVDGGECRLTWTDDGSGMTRGYFVLPRRTARLLVAELTRDADAADDPAARPTTLGRALCAFVERSLAGGGCTEDVPSEGIVRSGTVRARRAWGRMPRLRDAVRRGRRRRTARDVARWLLADGSGGARRVAPRP